VDGKTPYFLQGFAWKGRSMPKDKRKTVWSSQDGDMRKDIRYRKPAPIKSKTPQEQTAYLHRETKGRGGKTVTLVKNLVLSEKDMKGLAKKLKQACGTGGTIKDGIIEIQGDHRQQISDFLRNQGFNIKIAGG
jgi:predicted translation initiation factor SUI1